MKTMASLLAFIAVATLMMVTAPEADARPKYLKVFSAKFEEVKEEIDKKGSTTQKCGICHGNEGKNKKQLSSFAEELKKVLGKKNELDEPKIDEAMGKVAEKECEEGKTYGELLKDGKLPPPFKEEAK